MQRKNYKAYFTVEAAVLYPIVLGVIVLMTYLLFFQYDRCLLEQDMGRAAVRSGSRWMQKKEELAQILDCAQREVTLTPELEAVIAKDREELAGNFCRGCGYCMPCPRRTSTSSPCAKS